MTTAFRCSARSPTEKIPNNNYYSFLAIIVVGCFGHFADKRSMMNKAKIAPRIFISLKTCLTSAANQLSDDWSVGATPSVSSTSIKPRRKFFFCCCLSLVSSFSCFSNEGRKNAAHSQHFWGERRRWGVCKVRAAGKTEKKWLIKGSLLWHWDREESSWRCQFLEWGLATLCGVPWQPTA